MEDNKELTVDEQLELSDVEYEAYVKSIQNPTTEVVEVVEDVDTINEEVLTSNELDDVEDETEEVEDIEEETDEEEIDEVVDEDEDESISDEEVSEDISDTDEDEEEVPVKKFTIRYNKTDVELDEDKLKELAQKGMDYDIKKAKLDEASKTYDKIKANNLTDNDLEAYIKFKNDPENGLTDFFALNNINVEDFRNELYEVSNEDVEARQDYYEAEKENYNPITADIIPQRIETVNKIDSLMQDIPGLEQYSLRKVHNKDINGFEQILSAADDGSFEAAKAGFLQKFSSMNEADRLRLRTDDTFFEDTYNSSLQTYNKPVVNVETPTKPSKKMTLQEKEEKQKFAKPKPQAPTKVKKKKLSVQEETEAYLLMSDAEFIAHMKNNKK